MTDNAKILVVDDEAGIRFSMQEVLTKDGYAVITADSGAVALQKIEGQTFDLALLDLRLPDMSGLEILSKLRQHAPDTVVILLTAHASLDTAVQALRQGAHDYLFKPCKTDELRDSIHQGLLNREKALRQKGLLRQLEQHLSSSLQDLRATMTDETKTDLQAEEESTPEKQSETDERFLQQGGLIIDLVRHIITLEGELLELSPTEFDLVAYLAREAPRVVSPQELVREVQGYESEQWEASETVRYHVYRIRQKIKAVNKEAEVIHTVRGIGYTLGD